MLLESVFTLLYSGGLYYISSVQNFQKNTSEEETETTAASKNYCAFTPPPAHIENE